MATTRPFSRAMIEQALKDLDWQYKIDDDGEFNADFGHYTKGDCSLCVFLNAVGSDKEMLVGRTLLVKVVPRPKWGQALLACNKWNVNHYYPCAYLITNEENGNGFLQVQHGADLEKGTHQEFVTHLIQQLLGSGARFAEWVKNEYGWWE
jgi:hypothetical protein